MSVSAVIPAHNEMASIENVVRSCRRYCDEVIVIDDGSMDNTSEVSRAAGAKVIRNKVNLGIVGATKIGLRNALGDIIVTLDGDAQHDPSDIPNIVRPIILGGADLVPGTREPNEIPLSEQLITMLVNLRVKCRDSGTGYRAFRKSLARQIRLEGFCLCGTLVLEADRQGARITEVPTRLNPRRSGQSHWPSWYSRAWVHCRQTLLVLLRVFSRLTGTDQSSESTLGRSCYGVSFC